MGATAPFVTPLKTPLPMPDFFFFSSKSAIRRLELCFILAVRSRRVRISTEYDGPAFLARRPAYDRDKTFCFLNFDLYWTQRILRSIITRSSKDN